MIFDYIFMLFYQFVLFIMSFATELPDVTANNDLTTSIITFKAYYSSVDMFFPLLPLFAIIAFDLSFELKWFTYKLIRWAYTKVPFIN